ncbi:hypothetical protein HELRODRAFT_114081 [Helobdella robusta]|uniref:non-specific serine/threonine protein kinase n=1 Tax=Helobdella robusta TaxID=6412 RepID=T1EFY9_HELRO|nr:hypothetical protein HELRODRAFT_114081 [Helobdella robusta]ESN98009.1 hypothetical protein HELRODRAFT_114081 [Helobdella robusta]
MNRYLTDFEPRECLGQGGFGVVFKAFNRVDECMYAVKRIAILDSRVMREVKALAKLDHPGIVRSSNKSDNFNMADTHCRNHKKRKTSKHRHNRNKNIVSKLYLYIQMQLCQQESLQTWLSTSAFDLHLTLDIFHQMVSAISYVHDLGLMHRDLKPSNIFFAMDGSVKIGDFGLVTFVEGTYGDDDVSGDESGGAVGRAHTRQHTNEVGTRLYMSPEQTTGGGYDNKVDIYALGVIFYEMCQRFGTQMERVRALQAARDLNFHDLFVQQHPTEFDFVRPLLSHTATERPDARKILQHPLLAEFEGATLASHRLHSQSRLRIPSMSSSSSNSSSTPPNNLPTP